MAPSTPQPNAADNLSANLTSSGGIIPMSPTYQLLIDGLPANPTVQDRLISISTILNNGLISDQLTMTFHDRPATLVAALSLPEKGRTLDIYMGYGSSAAHMGSFDVNHISLDDSDDGRSLTVAATPPLMLTETSRTWAGKSIADIVQLIAKEQGLSARVSPAFKLQTIDVINQFNESDAAFLTRLAERYNAVCKSMANKLLFMQKG